MVKISIPIISGELKSRKIEITKNPNLRPILTRARTTMFDILFNFVNMKDVRVLDICAGSGILGIEALSRGAKEVVFFDIDKKICLELENNINKLELSHRGKIINKNIFFTGVNKEDAFDLVFIDLPYKSTFLVHKIIKKFFINNWINYDSLLVISMSIREKFDLKDLFMINQEKIVSNTRIVFAHINRSYSFNVSSDQEDDNMEHNEDMEEDREIDLT